MRILVAVHLIWIVAVGHAAAEQTREVPLRVGGGIAPPVRTKVVEAILPLGVSSRGPVVVELTVAPDGTVAEAIVLKEHPAADVAIAAIKQWVFEPTVQGGKAVWIRFTATITPRVRVDAGRADPPGNSSLVMTGIDPPMTVDGLLTVSSGPARSAQRWLTLITLDRDTIVQHAFVVTHDLARPKVEFNGNGRVVAQLASLKLTPANGAKGWEFVTAATKPEVSKTSTAVDRVDVERVSRVSISEPITHAELRNRLMGQLRFAPVPGLQADSRRLP
jgi:hypothetical protein